MLKVGLISCWSDGTDRIRRAARVVLGALGPAPAVGSPRSTRLALRSARRVVGRQPFSALLDRLGVDQDEGEDRGLRALGDTGMHRAALHTDVARLHRHSAAVVEFEVAFALEADRVVEGL